MTSFPALILFTVSLSISAQSIAQLSPAQKKITSAQQAIEKTPKQVRAYNELARGLLDRARESGDPAYLEQSAKIVEKSLAIEKDNYEGQRVMAGILLARHEYTRALDLAKALHKRNMDDLITWGVITDAEIALGRYTDAEKSAQWMLDLRPGDVGSLERGARLRELVGNADGATQLWILAFRAAPENETEYRALLLVEYGCSQLRADKVDEADKLMTQALQTFPDYHAALAGLARVRLAQHRYADAVELLHKIAYPTPANKYLLAEALDKVGQGDAAKRAFAEFEREANAASASPHNANHELVMYYSNHARQPAAAVRVARMEAARRQDIGTLDALAWALHANGDDAEARKQIDKVLAVGTRDPGILAHAAQIAPKSKTKAEIAP